MFRIVRNECVRRARLTFRSLGPPATAEPSAEDAALARLEIERVAASIAALPPEQRAVLVLRDIQGLSGAAAAQALGLSRAAMKSRLHRGRETVRADKHLRVDSTGLPSCTAAKLAATSPSAAMKTCGGALVGKGFVTAQVQFPEQAQINTKGLQLTWRLRALILTGEWASGERLPSLRALAESAGVNVNTVRAVYEGLQEQGLISSHQGQGTFVAAGAQAALRLEAIATAALRAAREAGLSQRDLAIVAMTRTRCVQSLPRRRRRPSADGS